jgi:hypothetical protein
MSEGPDIQHKPTFVSESGFTFKKGECAPNVGPDIFFDDPLAEPAGVFDLDSFLDLLLLGAKTRASRPSAHCDDIR